MRVLRIIARAYDLLRGAPAEEFCSKRIPLTVDESTQFRTFFPTALNLKPLRPKLKPFSSVAGTFEPISQERKLQSRFSFNIIGRGITIASEKQHEPKSMQQPTLPLNPMSSVPIAITTEQIQKYLDENKQLILAILENQNLGKLAECAQYQVQLQKNLLYLAAIADSQPNAPSVRPQMMPHGTMPQGGQFMQQAPMFPPRAPLQYNQPQGMMFPGQLGMRPGAVNGVHIAHPEPSHGAAGPALAGFPQTGMPGGAVDGRGNKHEAPGIGERTAADSHMSSGTEHGGGDAKRPDDTKTP